MTSKPGLQTVAIHILSNTSQSKGNHAMKFGQLIEPKSNIFLQKLSGKWGRETSSRPLFIFLKSLIWAVSKWSATYFQYISIALNLPYNKNKQYNILDYWSRDMVNFCFSQKGLRLVFLSHFEYGFSRKMFLVLHSINWPNFIVGLPLHMCIRIVCYPGCDVIKFQINLIFLIKLFQYMTKKSRQKLKYLKS